MSHQLDRRQLLRGLALSSGFAAFGGLGVFLDLLEARAETPRVDGTMDDHHYIFCNFPGGWDVLLTLDPRDPRQFNEKNMQDTQIYPAFEELDGYLQPDDPNPLIEPVDGMKLGPFVGDLEKWAHRLLVIRGMNMETLAHQAAVVRFLTGQVAAGGNARGSSTDTWLAAELGEENLIPNLSLDVDSYNKGLPNHATALEASGLDDLTRILERFAGDLGEEQEQLVRDFLDDQSGCPQTDDSETLEKAEQARQKASQILSEKLYKRFDFDSNPELGDSGKNVQEVYNLSEDDAEVQAAIAGMAITNDISRVVSCRLARNLDTHGGEWSSDQATRQQAGFDAVAHLAEHLDAVQYRDTGDSWLEHTTIVGFSEFSRTPLLNDRGGRDHWLMNACFLLGGDVEGGRVLGESTDYGMYPTKVDLKSGEVRRDDPTATNIHPEHVIQALYERAGVGKEGDGVGAGPDLRVEPLEAIFKST